jgi:hypothetical protein
MKTIILLFATLTMTSGHAREDATTDFEVSGHLYLKTATVTEDLSASIEYERIVGIRRRVNDSGDDRRLAEVLAYKVLNNDGTTYWISAHDANWEYTSVYSGPIDNIIRRSPKPIEVNVSWFTLMQDLRDAQLRGNLAPVDDLINALRSRPSFSGSELAKQLRGRPALELARQNAAGLTLAEQHEHIPDPKMLAPDTANFEINNIVRAAEMDAARR